MCPPPLKSISTSLSAHLAVVFHLQRGGELPSSPLGTGRGTWNSWCAPKTNYRGPWPPCLAEQEEGESLIGSIHRWALTRGRHWVGQMGGTAGAGHGFVLPRPECMECLNPKRLTGDGLYDEHCPEGFSGVLGGFSLKMYPYKTNMRFRFNCANLTSGWDHMTWCHITKHLAHTQRRGATRWCSLSCIDG